MHNKIAYYRKELNISQSELAKLAGISRQYLSKIENNKAKPAYDIVFKISESLKKNVNEIFFKNNVNLDGRKAYNE